MPVFARLLATAWHAGGQRFEFAGFLQIFANYANSFERNLFTSLKNKGFEFPSFIHETSIISTSTNLGEGLILSPICIIGPKIEIHKCGYINYQVGIAHEADIDPFTKVNLDGEGGFSIILR